MKKSFLFIFMMIVVFLGLGNVSFAQNAPCGAGVYCVSPNVCDSTCAASANAGAGTCGCVDADGNAVDSVSSATATEPATVTTNTDSNTVCTNSGSALIAKAHSKNTMVGCDCQDGYKQVGNECKSCSDPGVCCGISLNTSVPFIGNCIESNATYHSPGETNVTNDTAFPVLMGSLTKILVTVILIVSFILIVVGGIMIETGNPKGKDMIMKVVVGIAILGASGVILRLINPNFFG